MKSTFISTKSRSAAHLDWAAPLTSYLKAIYGGSLDLSAQVKQFARLRDCVSHDDVSLEHARDAYYRYYGQLELLDLRLPIGDGVNVKFKWFDSYDSSESHSQHSLAFEKASVLFNLGSVLSRLGEQAFQQADYKLAYQYFQYSAGVYKFVSENFLHAPSEDLSGKTMTFLLHLELAQAQEVFLLKVLKDDGKTSLIAKMAESCSVHYESAMDKFDKIEGDFGEDSWFHLLKFKQKFYKALGFYNHALSIEEKKVGEAIASLKAAIEDWKSLHSVHNETEIDYKNYISLAEDKLRVLTKENDLIYHDLIPSRDAVDVKPLDAAKAISLNDQKIEDVIGEDIFEKVIPMGVHEKLSLYSEEKAKMLREKIEMSETSDTELSSFLEYLKLPQSLSQFKDSLNQKLDEKLITWSETIAASKFSDIDRNSTTIQAKRDRISSTIKQLESKLQEEEQDYNSNAYKLGTSQDPSLSANASLRDELTSAKQSLVAASELDENIQKTIQGDLQDLQTLKSRQSLEAAFFASSNESLLDMSDNVGAESTKQSISKIESNLRILNAMKSERGKVIEDLKNAVHEDDISSILVLNNKSLTEKDEKELFAQELKKFDSFNNRLDELAYKQTQVVKAVKKEYQSLLSSNSGIKDNQQKLCKFQAVFTHFQDYEANLNKGMSFYDNLLTFVSQVESNVNSFVQNRKSQRQRLLSQSQAATPDPLAQRFEALRMNSTSSQAPMSPQTMYQQPLPPSYPGSMGQPLQPSQPQFNPSYSQTPPQPPQAQYSTPSYSYAPPVAPKPPSYSQPSTPSYSQPSTPSYSQPAYSSQPLIPSQYDRPAPPQPPMPQGRPSYSSSTGGSISSGPGAPPLPPKQETAQDFYAQKSTYDASMYRSFAAQTGGSNAGSQVNNSSGNYGVGYTQPYDPSKYQ